MVDYNCKHRRLRLLIRGSGMSQQDVARYLGITAQAIGCKLSGKIPWKLWEVYKICNLLDQPLTSVPDLFPADEQKVISTM